MPVRHRDARYIPPALLALGWILALQASGPAGQVPDYPKTRTVDHVDTYHGVKVPDPYRWLEDDNSPETAAWVEAQNKVTFAYLERIPFRGWIKARLEKLYNYEKYSVPALKGGRLYYRRNDGLQNQSVLYVQQGLEGKPEVLLDPNAWSADGTTRLTVFSVSKDGSHAVYGISRAGSDWQEFKVMDLATRTTLPETLQWIKVSGVAWHGRGFYYSRYPAPEKGRELSSRNENHQVYYHRLGTPQAEDELVYQDPAHPQRFHGLSTTDDERFAVLSISERGLGKKGNALYVRDLSKNQRDFVPLVSVIGDATFTVVDNVGDRLLVVTNHGAPNRRIVLIDPARPEESHWQTVLPERPEPLESADVAGGRLFVSYLEDVSSRAYVYRLDGTVEHEITLPALGSVEGFDGGPDDPYVFYSFSSFTYPPAVYRYDIATRQSTVFRAPAIPHFDPGAYETRQVFYTSKDGTRVPMFLVHRKGLRLDGTNPALLYGYGGFNIVQRPAFNVLRLALVEQGFVYAVANLRGGGEYGEAWHEAGTKLKKQNVFDDFIAAAEWLVANKYTSPQKLAILGGSNGGLLVGAVINQRPDLFRVAIPQVGVMDMLRFHKFTIGWNWIADYGSSDDPEEFKALYAYSPLHNIRAGVVYPATLVTTADHDDRVVPAHSFKYAATLQEKASRTNPVLIRIETQSGHGASSTAKQIETTADIYAFIFHNLGIAPKDPSH
jgi:prolyl oligopeptidase